MDRLRSFFDDLGLFDDEEYNKTDSDKSSIDTKSIDIEQGAGATAVDSSPSDTQGSLVGSSRRRLSMTRNSSQRSVKSYVATPIRRISNSMVEEDDDDDDDVDHNDFRKTSHELNDAASDLKKGEARSFTRFRFRSRSNIETDRFPTGASSSWHGREDVATTKDIASCKTVIPDDTAIDETAPANLFGYACGVEFCTSMELMNKIQGNDDDVDDENAGSILDDDNNSNGNNGKQAPNPMEKKRSFLWKTKTAGIDSTVGMKMNPKTMTDTKTVTTEATGDSNSNSSIHTKTHLRRWGHSKIWTITALLFALTGCVCAILTRQSIHFVTLGQPLIITELYEPIYHMGIIRVQICTNTSAAVSSTSLTESEDEMMNVTTAPSSSSSSSSVLMESPACTTTRFTREEVSDRLFNLSRSLLTLGTYLGIALTLVLTTSIVWETINLRPIAFGYLVAYFFQSFSMLFFDTELCREYECQISTGGYLSIITSVCWIVSLISVVRMDLFKLQSIRLRRREERKAKREARRQERKALALRKRQQREQMMIIDNFQRNNTQSVDMLDIEAVLNSEQEYQAAVVTRDKKVMAL